MTTKEQERKVLAQIRELVDSLGEDSYIGIAFDGCFQVAEENIRNDWGCSMKQRAESAEENLKRITADYEILAGNHRRLRADFETVCIEKFEAENSLGCRENEVLDLKKEVISLKAKLYDMMVKDA